MRRLQRVKEQAFSLLNGSGTAVFAFRRKPFFIYLTREELVIMDISEVRFASRFDQVTGSAIREIFKVIAQPGMISFAGGNPSLEALPDQQVSELAQYVLAHDGKAILQYGATEGYPPFVESLKSYVEDQLGVSVPAVLPVTGSTQAMDLLCKALLDPGDTVLVENPSFLGNLQCLKLYQANLVPVESDEDGLIPDDLEQKIIQYHPKLLYTIPTFQNPTGKTLPDSRRRAVADLANRYGMVVAEDDPYRDLRYEGEKVKPSNPMIRMAGLCSSAVSARPFLPDSVSDILPATPESSANALSANNPRTFIPPISTRLLLISTSAEIFCLIIFRQSARVMAQRCAKCFNIWSSSRTASDSPGRRAACSSGLSCLNISTQSNCSQKLGNVK